MRGAEETGGDCLCPEIWSWGFSLSMSFEWAEAGCINLFFVFALFYTL